MERTGKEIKKRKIFFLLFLCDFIAEFFFYDRYSHKNHYRFLTDMYKNSRGCHNHCDSHVT